MQIPERRIVQAGGKQKLQECHRHIRTANGKAVGVEYAWQDVGKVCKPVHSQRER